MEFFTPSLRNGFLPTRRFSDCAMAADASVLAKSKVKAAVSHGSAQRAIPRERACVMERTTSVKAFHQEPTCEERRQSTGVGGRPTPSWREPSRCTPIGSRSDVLGDGFAVVATAITGVASGDALAIVAAPVGQVSARDRHAGKNEHDDRWEFAHGKPALSQAFHASGGLGNRPVALVDEGVADLARAIDQKRLGNLEVPKLDGTLRLSSRSTMVCDPLA
jgi:hypothetical protein